MSSPQRNKTDAAMLADLLSSHGIRRERKVAAALQDSKQALRKRQKSTLYISLAWLLNCALLINPIASHALHAHAVWALTLLGIFICIHLAWMIQMLKLAKAWIGYRNLKELE